MERPDWRAIRGGLIPWSASEYHEVLEEAHRLMQTPHDDWDRRPQRFTIYDEDTGEEQALEVDVDNVAFQIDNLILKRYADQPQDVVLSHVYRFRMIFRFIEDNLERLVVEGLIKDEPEAMQVAEGLIEVLATARYEATRIEGDEEVSVFDCDQVVDGAKRLQGDMEEESS
ncbi:hypothetical protein AMJ82_05625 [candidate division TA06 bacterium SM23_40]|uniref:Uncharacterized protein n=1 Tax=candidate division TA06 bacterium SM23_40 TaxID=1703774 RepID=A0A0S8GA26_UNCT6|nr:MAG: hypothetical protein AMJ82_05625 [candidate division TA06 bacterium SM23_40]